VTDTFARFGLGTAQFGGHYGISNRFGQPNESEVAAILARAAEMGIGYLDTAASYGGAEILIGRHLPRGHRLRIVTKLPAVQDDAIEARHGAGLVDAVAASLTRLRIDRLYGVIVHQASDLGKSGWQHVVEALEQCRARGWVARIGASIYDTGELALVESRFKPELIQLPFNAVDHRLVGAFGRLAALGSEVHARSVFLQGLLLMEPDAIPGYFSPLRGRIADLHARWDAEGRSPLAGSLRFVLRDASIDAAIIGVNCLSELDDIMAVIERMAAGDCGRQEVVETINALGPATAIEERYLDPRRWPATTH
jgi:aryl-alcohol dehydrogenase-like predicted oxidoreductase